jgi:hypothetical protein
MDGGVC